MEKRKLKPISDANLIDGYMRLKNSDGKDSIYALDGPYWLVTCRDSRGVYWLCYWQVTDDNLDGDVYGLKPDFVLRQYYPGKKKKKKKTFWGLSDILVELEG